MYAADSAVKIFCLDLGIEKIEPITSLRRLDREFINFLPNASGISIKLSGRISDGTKKMIGQMMRIDNHFRVHVTEHTWCSVVRLTHITTDFSFGGNITAEMALNFRRKLSMLEQRKEAVQCDINLVSHSAPSIVSQFTHFTHPLGHQVDISPSANGQHTLTIDNDTFNLSLTNLSIKLADVYRLVKKYESDSEIKIRLLIRKAQNSAQLQSDNSGQYAIGDIIQVMTKSSQSSHFINILQSIKNM